MGFSFLRSGIANTSERVRSGWSGPRGLGRGVIGPQGITVRGRRHWNGSDRCTRRRGRLGRRLARLVTGPDRLVADRLGQDGRLAVRLVGGGPLTLRPILGIAR